MAMYSVSALVTRSFGARDTESRSTDDGLDRGGPDRSRNRLLSGRRSADGSRVTESPPASEHGHTLIDSPPQWLHDFSPLCRVRPRPAPDDVAAAARTGGFLDMTSRSPDPPTGPLSC